MSKIINHALTIFIVFCVALMPAQAHFQNSVRTAQFAFYVSSNGNDLTGNGSLAYPWNSLQKARDYIRENYLNRNMTGDIIVYIRAGKYSVNNTIEFSDKDSGTNGFNVIYKNYDGIGSPEFIGGEQISNWTRFSGNVYKASVTPGWKFYTLYENGDRARMGRYPSYSQDGTFANSQAPYLFSAGEEGSRTVLQYNPEDLDPVRWNLANAQVHIWSGGEHDWFSDTVPIASINTVTHQIILARETRYPITLNGKGSRFYIQGITVKNSIKKLTEESGLPEANNTAKAMSASLAISQITRPKTYTPLLNGPGEFYLDSAKGELYYWPKNSDINNQTIIAPKVKSIISIIGASENVRANHIQFEGLTFECTDFTDWYRFAWVRSGDSGESHRYPEFDRQIELPANRTGMIYLENTDHIVYRYNRMRDAGFSAVYMLFCNQNNLVYGNLFERLGYNAVTIQGRYPGEGDVSGINVISNNYIHHIGELVGHASGVEVTNSGSNEVSYSTIHDAPRYAVQWRGRPNIPKDAIYLRDNVFKYLKIYNCGQDSGDTAPVYGYGISNESPYLTNTVEQITVNNIYAHPSMKDIAPNGVFMDNGSYGQTFKNAIVTNTQGSPFRNNDSGNHSFVNVSWMPGFNGSLIDYSNIGVKRDFPYPVTPTGLAARDNGAGVSLSWEKVNNAVAYNVKRSTSENGPYDTTVCSEVTSLSCNDITASSELYYYVVTSIPETGMESSISNIAAPAIINAANSVKVDPLTSLFEIVKVNTLLQRPPILK